eukprot:6181774-Pleurochrysis_carterae.AAC.1
MAAASSVEEKAYAALKSPLSYCHPSCTRVRRPTSAYAASCELFDLQQPATISHRPSSAAYNLASVAKPRAVLTDEAYKKWRETVKAYLPVELPQGWESEPLGRRPIRRKRNDQRAAPELPLEVQDAELDYSPTDYGLLPDEPYAVPQRPARPRELAMREAGFEARQVQSAAQADAVAAPVVASPYKHEDEASRLLRELTEELAAMDTSED